MQIQFQGAAQTVTGSQTIIRHYGSSCLVDCGLFQGPKIMRQKNWNKPFYFHEIKSMILTHAHIDHSGLIPRWVSWGWRGPIYCTPATAELLKVMLPDSARLQEEDARFANRTKHSFYDPALPLYTEVDAQNALKMLYQIPYDQWQSINSNLSFRFVNAGHILGSASVQFSYSDDKESKLLTFSGDLGGAHSDLIKDTQPILETNSLVLESTYGDRSINIKGREDRLAEVITKVYNRGGTLVIPAFALGRTQDLLYSIHKLKTDSLIPDVPIYLDSPMAKAITRIYNKHMDELKIDSERLVEEALSERTFKAIESPDESMLLSMSDEPKIILSASGMLQGGRVLHHLKTKLPGKNNGVLFVGFQGKETKGRLLQEGILSIRLHHKEIPVEAEIFTIEGYSAHGDSEDLIKWIGAMTKKPDTIFLNHGEPEAQMVFAEKLKNLFNINVIIPVEQQSFDL